MLSLPCSSSSPDSSDSSPDVSIKKCAVCDLPARGKHFGALSCRACAAFFRRTSPQINTLPPCKKSNNCKLFNGNGWFQCKKCRLEKCFKVGMSMRNFQFDRDAIRSKIQILAKNMPSSIEEFIGRPHFVISCEPSLLKMRSDLNIIDCEEFVEKGRRILLAGSATPLHLPNTLQRIAEGMRQMEARHKKNVKIVKKYGESETMAFWENDFLRAAQWFTYFDEFQKLDHFQQLKILASVWHVWARLDKLAITAMGRRKNLCGDLVMFSRSDEYMVMDLKGLEIDLTWCSRLTNQQMQFFYDTSENNICYKFVDEMVSLNPDDVELSYMLADLALTHAAQRFCGDEIQEICEGLMEKLANDLHDYYVNQKETPRYSMRLTRILKMNRKIREEVLQIRSRLQLAKVFNVHTVEFSHISFFEDL